MSLFDRSNDSLMPHPQPRIIRSALEAFDRVLTSTNDYSTQTLTLELYKQIREVGIDEAGAALGACITRQLTASFKAERKMLSDESSLFQRAETNDILRTQSRIYDLVYHFPANTLPPSVTAPTGGALNRVERMTAIANAIEAEADKGALAIATALLEPKLALLRQLPDDIAMRSYSRLLAERHYGTHAPDHGAGFDKTAAAVGEIQRKSGAQGLARLVASPRPNPLVAARALRQPTSEQGLHQMSRLVIGLVRLYPAIQEHIPAQLRTHTGLTRAVTLALNAEKPEPS